MLAKSARQTATAGGQDVALGSEVTARLAHRVTCQVLRPHNHTNIIYRRPLYPASEGAFVIDIGDSGKYVFAADMHFQDSRSLIACCQTC